VNASIAPLWQYLSMQKAPTLAIALDSSLGWRSVGHAWRVLYPQDVPLAPSWIETDRVAPAFRVKYAGRKMRQILGRLNMSYQVNRQIRDVSPAVALVGNMVLNLMIGRHRFPIFTILDATQIQLQAFGAAYGIYPSKYKELEKIKHRMRCRAYRECAGIFSFSDWAKKSLIADYGVESQRVHVIQHGAVVERWRREARSEAGNKICNILFVGGDFKRKGGGLLLDWAARTKERHWHMHIVTKDRVSTTDSRITVHNGIVHEDGRLTELFAAADVFALPTFVDISPLAIAEALASGLPVVTSTVGAVPEMIIQGVTGFALPLDQTERLFESLDLLINDPAARLRMGAAARKDAELRFDARRNIRAMVEVIASTI
jgi:glycosyltransferase involved in cell wall biosynthesis